MKALISRRRVLLCLAAVLGWALLHTVSAVVATGPAARASDTGSGTGGGELAASTGSFVIEGDSVSLLGPGIMAPLDLKFTNPQAVSMSITDVTVTVLKVRSSSADRGHSCAVADFTVDQVSPGLQINIAPRAARTLSNLEVPSSQWPKVGLPMRSFNQDGCKGASLTLGFTASGTRAG
jgi:hypothetical protein